MDYVKIRKQLIEHEGLRLKPYKCPAGKLTIGIGRNLDDNGISETEALDMLYNDVGNCLWDLKEMFPIFDHYPENIQLALTDMRFQLGPAGFRSFKKMIQAVKNEDWPEMIKQMKYSKWYDQVPTRANHLVALVKEVIE